MSRTRDMLGAAAGALLSAGIVTATAASLYLRSHNQGQEAMVKAPPVAYARALARKTAQDLDNGPEIQRFLDQLAHNGQPVRLAAVIVEPEKPRYRFLRARRYLAHSTRTRASQLLSPTVEGDKAIFDLASQVRRRGSQLEIRSPASGPFEVQAAEPVLVDGHHRATTVVVTWPHAPDAPVPAWPLMAGLMGCLVVGLLSGRLAPRLRYLPVMVATTGQTLLAYLLLLRLGEGYYQALDHVGQSLARGLGAIDGQETARLLLAGLTVEPPPTWLLLPALVLGLGLAVLGLLGIGRRIVAALVDHHLAYGYVLPASLGMLTLVFIPFGYGVALGFFNHSHGTYTFVGLDNFIEILSGGGRPLTHPLNFYFTLGVTILWTAANVVTHVVIGLALALLLKDPLLRFKGIYRVLLILPWAVPNYITALIWKGMFHQQYGAVNHLLSLIGIEKISWFSSFSTAFIANLTTNIWLGFPFMMVVSLGALQSIPADVYEAADVDGASRWQSFWNITLPLLRPALFPAIVLGTIWTFNQFNIIYLVSGGAPAGATDILITEAYRWAFERADRYGLASAYALIIFFILLGYTLISNRLTRASEDAA